MIGDFFCIFESNPYEHTLSVVIIIWATSFILKTIDNEIDNGILDYNSLYNYSYNNYFICNKCT